MTEEINYSSDGGLYGELICNRNFKEDAKDPVHWRLVQERGGSGSIALDSGQPLNDVVPVSLKLTISQASGDQRVGIANEGFWGIRVKPRTSYNASFLSIVSKGGAASLATAQVARITDAWAKYDVMLTTSASAKASADRRRHATP
jgi:alpha-N-arabinofuranosidase